MTRSVIVSINGVIQAPADFVLKGHRIVFNRAPGHGAQVDIKSMAGQGVNTASYHGVGTQTTFNMPAWPRGKFEVIADSSKSLPTGYTVIDVDPEIDLWIRENCPVSDWKWADQRVDDAKFGMTRFVVRESIVTYIATRWAQ